MDRSVFERFLRNIHIENVDDYDMSFDMCEWSPLSTKEKILEMVIRKDIPWDYNRLMTFLYCLTTITTYKYHIIYKYNTMPTNDDVYHLFSDWYYANNNIAFFR